MRDSRSSTQRTARDTQAARVNRNKPFNSMAKREQQQASPDVRAAGVTGNFSVRSARRQGLK
jgi:hypothetical protein